MNKEIKYGAILGYINMVVNIFVALFFTPVLLKTLGQTEYGLYSLIAGVMAYLSILDMGLGNAMVRFVARSQAKKDKCTSSINSLFLILYTIIGILAFIIGIIICSKSDVIFAKSLNVFELEKAKTLILILTASISISFPLSIFDSYIVANEKFAYIKALTVFKNILKPLLMLPLLLLGHKSISMTLVVAFSNVLFHVMTMLYAIFVLKMKFTFSLKNIDKQLLKEIFFYSFFIFLNIIVDNIYSNTDHIILGIVCGTVAVSVYAVATQITQMNTQCSTIISGLFLPKITKLLETKDGEKEISSLFIKVSRIQMYLMMLVLFGFITFGYYFIYHWAGAEYVDAYYIVLILISPAVIPLTQNIGISILQAKNIHQFRSIIYIIIAVINIIISIPLAQKWAGIGAAIGTAIANLIGQITVMNIYYYKKVHIDIPTYWKYFLRLFIQYALLSAVFFIINRNIIMNMPLFIFEAVIFTLIYFGITYLNMNSEEREFVNVFLKTAKLKVLKK